MTFDVDDNDTNSWNSTLTIQSVMLIDLIMPLIITDYFSQTTNVNQIAKQYKLKPEDYALVLISKM